MISKILVAVDGSDSSKRAIELTGDIARSMNASLCFLYVVQDIPLPRELEDMVKANEITASRLELYEDSGRIILDNARKQAAEVGVENVETELCQGDPADMILRWAQAQGVDMIAMGNCGLGHGQSKLLGGVARRVCNQADITCLTVS